LANSLLKAQSVQSSTISAGGATVQVNGKYYSHVVGQQSVAGTVRQNGITLRQGFKQPNLLLRSIKNSYCGVVGDSGTGFLGWVIK
jgi:hypothetical protein